MVTWTAPANIYYVSSVTHGKVLVLTFPNNLSRPTWSTYSWFRFASYLNDGRASILAFSDESLNLQALTIARNTCKIKCVNSKTCLRNPPPPPSNQKPRKNPTKPPRGKRMGRRAMRHNIRKLRRHTYFIQSYNQFNFLVFQWPFH